MFSVGGHGSPQSITDNRTTNGHNGDLLSPEKLLKLMMAKGYQKGTPIYLLSCDIGAGSESFISKLAALAGATVGGPNTSFWSFDNGTMFDSQFVKEQGTGRVLERPDISKPGRSRWFGPDGNEKFERGYNSGYNNPYMPGHSGGATHRLPSQLPNFR